MTTTMLGLTFCSTLLFRPVFYYARTPYQTQYIVGRGWGDEFADLEYSSGLVMPLRIGLGIED